MWNVDGLRQWLHNTFAQYLCGFAAIFGSKSAWILRYLLDHPSLRA
jgi:hypothetical protein